MLVRAVASGWQKCSMVAVDAGVHLSAIVQILESTQPSNLASLPLPHTLETGPFAGLQLHSASTHVNAAHIARSLVETYLITHPHLDHIAGFVVNTAGVPGGPRPKRLAGLPATIDAFQQHIFNNVIWPNLSDENGGVGLVTYTRLVDGGSLAIGDGEAQGYLEVAEGLSVKACSISHGSPIESTPPAHRGSQSSAAATGTPVRHASFDASSSLPPRHYSVACPPYPPHQSQQPQQPQQQQQYQQQQPQQQQYQQHCQPPIPPRSTVNLPPTPRNRIASCPYVIQQPPTPNCLDAPPPPPPPHPPAVPVYDSTVYFLRDSATGSEILVFGDVEPDALSSFPRNLSTWKEAAPKIARGALRAIIIECSYDDSQCTDRLFGHMKPSFVMEELRTLAQEVDMVRRLSNAGSSDSVPSGKEAAAGGGVGDTGVQGSHKKRKRLQVDCDSATVSARRKTGPLFTSGGGGGGGDTKGRPDSEAVSPKTVRSRFNSHQDDGVGSAPQKEQELPPPRSGTGTPHIATPTAELSLKDVIARDFGRSTFPSSPQLSSVDDGVDGAESTLGAGTTTARKRRPLEGLKVIIIHVKDKLDGVDQGAKILKELQMHEDEAQTGVEFVLSYSGQSIYV